MKKYIFAATAVLSMAFAMQANAATGSGLGCNTWGKVTYLYQSAAGTSLAIVNGYACFISGATARDVSVMSAILSQAEASNKDAIIEITSAGVNVAMNP